jgi:hypothetical protein
MKLPNKVYDVLKWIVVIFLPALNTLIFALGGVLGFETNVICGVISAVTVFLGALIGVSTYSYKKENSDE